MKWLKWIGIVLAALIILPLAGLLIASHRPNAGRAQASVEIAASPQQLWTWIDDGDKLKQWVSWMVDVRYPDPQKTHGAGSSRVLVMKDENNGGMLMSIKSDVSEYAPPAKMTVHLSDADGMFSGDQTYTMSDLGNGRTRMEVHSNYHFTQWFAGLMEPLITPSAEKKMTMDVAHLKSLVENQAAVR